MQIITDYILKSAGIKAASVVELKPSANVGGV
jgi:hypothetical protein